MLYICMSVAGSIPVLLCLVLWLLQKQSYDFRLGKMLLLMSMFFYLVPFQLVKHVLPKWTIPLLQLPMQSTSFNVEQDFNKLVEVKSILSPGDSIWISKWIFAVLAIWLFCIVIFSVYQIVKYRIDIRRMLAQSERRTVDVNGEMVELLVNKNIRTPYTVGFIKQSIIVPEASLEHPCFEMCYKHENQHRRNHDSLIKLLCVIIICIHWFNPIAILLLCLYSVTAEYICDSKAVEGCSDNEKKRYAKLLVGLSTMEKSLSMVWRNNLSGSENLMRRRISYMMKRKGLMKRGIAIVVTAITLFASASTILAYEPFVSTDENVVVASDFGQFGGVIEEDVSYSCDFSISDTVIVHEDGSQEIVTDDDFEPRALCNHIMKSCYYYVHSSNGSGGCTMYIYNAQQCTRCGYITLGSLHQTVISTVCPH